MTNKSRLKKLESVKVQTNANFVYRHFVRVVNGDKTEYRLEGAVVTETLYKSELEKYMPLAIAHGEKFAEIELHYVSQGGEHGNQ